MAYKTSKNYKSLVYEPSTQHLLKIYINDKEVETQNIKSCNSSHILLAGEEFTLGSVVAQTIELELNKIAVPEIIEKIYIESGIEGEVIPIGYFKLDEPITRNGRICKLKIIDDMVKFEPSYNGSVLNYPCTLKVVLQDICSKMGVELRFYFFFEYEHRSCSIG